MTSQELDEIIAKLRADKTDAVGVEAKASLWQLPRDLWQVLSAFSNAPGGGVLILGLDESNDFAVSGLVDPGKTQADLASLCDQMEPPLRPLIQMLPVEGQTVVVAQIPEIPRAQKPAYFKGQGLTAGAYIRVGDGNRSLTQYEVQMLLAARGQPLDDLRPVPDTGIADLDRQLVDQLLRELQTRSPAIFGDMGVEDALLTTRVLIRWQDELLVTRAGLIALGRYPQAFLPQARVTFAVYPRTRIGELGERGERFIDNLSIEGPISSIVTTALSRLQANMRRGGAVAGVLREDRWEYPQVALREALVNALAHRDLSDAALGTPVEIQMFPDRLVLINPGGLFGPVGIEQLGESGISSARNQYLLRLLEDLHVAENRGTGIGVMVSALRRAGLRPPQFEDRISAFVVTFQNHTLVDESTMRWLAEFDDLTESQRVGLALMREGGAMSNSVYRNATGLDSRAVTRELAQLVERGLVAQRGFGRWTTYELASEPRQMTLPQGPSPVDADVSTRIAELLARRGELSRRMIERELQLRDRGARAALRELVERGAIRRVGHPRSPRARYRTA